MNATFSAKWCCILRKWITANWCRWARYTPRALPIYSSPNFPEPQHEHQFVADPPGVLGKSRDLDDSRHIRRIADRRRPVRPGQHPHADFEPANPRRRGNLSDRGRIDVLCGDGG